MGSWVFKKNGGNSNSSTNTTTPRRRNPWSHQILIDAGLAGGLHGNPLGRRWVAKQPEVVRGLMARDSRVTVLFPTALGELWHVDAKYAQFKKE